MDKATLEELLGVELTDEQFEGYNKRYESEVDKARNQASTTAAKNAAKKAADEARQTLETEAAKKAQELLQDLLTPEKERLEKQLEERQKELAAKEAQLLQDKKVMAIEAKLKAAGYKDESLENLTKVFAVGDTPDACVQSLDTFLEGVNKTVEERVDKVKAELTGGGTPPKSGTGSQVSSVVDEGKILADVYKHAEDEGFDNSRRSNFNLDVAAIMALEAAQQSGNK